jgi:hypothetical protein
MTTPGVEQFVILHCGNWILFFFFTTTSKKKRRKTLSVLCPISVFSNFFLLKYRRVAFSQIVGFVGLVQP